jgi:hypothetical protein
MANTYTTNGALWINDKVWIQEYPDLNGVVIGANGPVDFSDLLELPDALLVKLNKVVGGSFSRDLADDINSKGSTTVEWESPSARMFATKAMQSAIHLSEIKSKNEKLERLLIECTDYIYQRTDDEAKRIYQLLINS